MIIIKNPDKEIVVGKLTIYEDVPDTILESLSCPCCDKYMLYLEDTKITGQNTTIKEMTFCCMGCQLTFKGYEDYYHFKDIKDFHKFVKGKLNVQINP